MNVRMLFCSKVSACGYVVLLTATSEEVSDLLKLINPSYDAFPKLATIEQEITDVGFSECFRRQFQVSTNMCPPFEDEFVEWLAYLQAVSGVDVGVKDVRAALEHEFNDKNNTWIDTRYLIVYRKPQSQK